MAPYGVQQHEGEWCQSSRPDMRCGVGRHRVYLLAAVQVQLAWRQHKQRKYEEMGSSSAAYSLIANQREEAAR